MVDISSDHYELDLPTAKKRLGWTPKHSFGNWSIIAAAITTFAPPIETFSKDRDVAACVCLKPRQHSSGGKKRPGRTSKMGHRRAQAVLHRA
ncbi:IS110 family transposase [Oceaniovalibus sp. ACAM 378]|uniref:IS110 family transposase n=1 Tax=Oceaniovalibus sp. ACAM 378 TaxID=2599923 RepID=UPI002106B5CD|nr:IS110 family transposase [Oceaniovalibus sp. ACAM 378]